MPPRRSFPCKFGRVGIALKRSKASLAATEAHESLNVTKAASSGKTGRLAFASTHGVYEAPMGHEDAMPILAGEQARKKAGDWQPAVSRKFWGAKLSGLAFASSRYLARGRRKVQSGHTPSIDSP